MKNQTPTNTKPDWRPGVSQGSLNMESDRQGGLSYWGKEKTLALSCENTGLQRHPWALPGANLGGYRQVGKCRWLALHPQDLSSHIT